MPPRPQHHRTVDHSPTPLRGMDSARPGESLNVPRRAVLLDAAPSTAARCRTGFQNTHAPHVIGRTFRFPGGGCKARAMLCHWRRDARSGLGNQAQDRLMRGRITSEAFSVVRGAAESQLSASQPALSIVCVSIPAGADLTAPLLRRAVLGKLDWGLYCVVGVTVRPTETRGRSTTLPP